MADPRPLHLRAEDDEDLTVIAAAVQSAVAKVGDIAYQPNERRFAVMMNRFRWESPNAGSTSLAAIDQRVRSALRFDYVTGVQASGIDHRARDRVLELLTISARLDGANGAEVNLVFAGNATIRLQLECIDLSLDDIGRPWQTKRRPNHRVASED